MKNGTPGNDAQFFWTTTTSGNFSETRSKHIPIIPTDAGFTEYTADLATVAAWSGTVTSMRFDPANAAGRLEIDSIVLRDNRPPLADASATQLVHEATSWSGATVTLDGSLSSDPDGDPLMYEWFEEGNGIATGATSAVVLSIGTHAIQLKVTDPFGASSTAGIVVTVQVRRLPLDIRPDSCPNLLTVNLKSKGRLPMAILGTAGTSVAAIDLNTITLAGTGLRPMKSPSMERVATPGTGDDCPCGTEADDGYDDLVLHYSIHDLILELGLGARTAGEVVTITVQGSLNSGTPFEAKDCVILAAP
jgi:hypothetical protein